MRALVGVFENFGNAGPLNIRGVSDSGRNTPLPVCDIMPNLAALGPQKWVQNFVDAVSRPIGRGCVLTPYRNMPIPTSVIIPNFVTMGQDAYGRQYGPKNLGNAGPAPLRTEGVCNPL